MDSTKNISYDHFPFSLEIFPRIRKIGPHLRKGGISCHIDEIYIKIRDIWHYLCRAIDFSKDVIDFMFFKKRNFGAALYFLGKYKDLVIFQT